MTLLHDAYTALLSGLTHRTGNEIHWHDENGHPITVEPVDVEVGSYVVKYYREDGNLYWEIHYLQDQRHGKSIGWYENGQLQWETGYHQGQMHGKDIKWYTNGQLYWEINYIQKQRHGKSIFWDKSGQTRWEIDYHQDQLHGKSIMLHSNGVLIYEDYYINGRLVTHKEWERYNESIA